MATVAGTRTATGMEAGAIAHSSPRNERYEDQKIRSIIAVRQYALERLVDGPLASARPEVNAAARKLLTTPDPGLDAALEQLDALEDIFPLLIGDAELAVELEFAVSLQAREVYGNIAPTAEEAEQVEQIAARWRDSSTLPPNSREQAEHLLRSFVRRRNDVYRHDLGVRRVKREYLTVFASVLVGLVVLLAVFAVAAAQSDSVAWDILLAGMAGAVGGALSGILRLRESTEGLQALQASWAKVAIQPAIGAAAGLIVFMLFASGFVTVQGLEFDAGSDSFPWHAVAVVAFLGGFSERFFLRSLGGRGETAPLA